MAQASYTDDFYQREARRLGLRARSYFKLEEIDQKEKLFAKPHLKVLDLGAAPGSWSQYVLGKTKGQVELTMIDLQKIDPIPHYPNVKIIQGNVEKFSEFDVTGPFDIVLSDMAPATAGQHATDSILSAELVYTVLGIADKLLKPKGVVVIKYLQGGDLPDLQKRIKTSYQSYRIFKPQSSRKNSTETFFIARK